MNNRVDRYASGRTYLIAGTSPGFAMHEDAHAATNTSSVSVLEPPIETQNEMIRCRRRVYDRLLDACPTAGSGADTIVNRVWFEVATQFPEVAGSADLVSTSIAELVAEIRSTLSLQIKELAEVLGVERPTVYSWLRGESRPQTSNRARLAEVCQVVVAWKRESDSPIGNSVRASLDENGRSLLDDLRSPTLDIGAISRRLRRIGKDTMSSGETKSILDIARSTGIDLSKVEEQVDVLDVVSGRRRHED